MGDEANEPAEGAKPRRNRSRSSVQAIGGVLAGFEAQVFRASRPPAELVEQAQPVRGATGQDGSLLSIEFPVDPAPDDPAPDGAKTPA